MTLSKVPQSGCGFVEHVGMQFIVLPWEDAFAPESITGDYFTEG